ncbi:MAG: hypothetical protein LUH11_04080, partial [Candidatus Gastranaerophilales bacterium]|nr:hypothetical protein [Candidatus Gastranaerophilales bacterium]
PTTAASVKEFQEAKFRTNGVEWSPVSEQRSWRQRSGANDSSERKGISRGEIPDERDKIC